MTMTFKDGFLAEHAELPRQLGWAPHFPDTIDAEGFFEAYSAQEDIEALKSEQAQDARALFESQEDREEPEYETLEDVPLDTIHRARVYENGDVDFFYCPEDYTGEASIGEDETPIMQLTREKIYTDFGIADPLPSLDISAGLHKCQLTFALTDESQFREDFKITEGQPLSEANMKDVLFSPAERGDMGAKLTSVDIEERGSLLVVTLTAEVENPDHLLATATRVGRATGRDEDYVPPAVHDAIFECWLGGNDTGPIADYGIELEIWGPASEAADPEPGM